MPRNLQDESASGGIPIGFLIGFGFGVAVALTSALLLSPRSGSRRREALLDKAKAVADRVVTITQGRDGWRERKAERADKTLVKRIHRIRSAGL